MRVNTEYIKPEFYPNSQFGFDLLNKKNGMKQYMGTAAIELDKEPATYHFDIQRQYLKDKKFIKIINVSIESTVDENYINPSSIDILKNSSKIEFLDANNLFDIASIDENITFEDFLKMRNTENIPIEEYILKERYG